MRFILLCCILALITACNNPPPIDLTPTALAANSTLTNDAATLCASIVASWDRDWSIVIAALEKLITQNVDCADDQPSAGKLYAARFNYGAALQEQDQKQAAISQYYAALEVNPTGREALAALRDLDVPTPNPLPLAACDQSKIPVLPTYQPSDTAEFVRIEERHFIVGNEIFVPQGINYFPAQFPWRRFLTEADQHIINVDFDLLQATGFNTLRIFLWYEALFQCPGSGAVPIPETFALLDAIIQSAAEHGFRLIVTLNDLPDLTQYPLYTDPPHIRAQTAFIVERYRDEAAIMAWDLRNEGDIDYQREDQDRDSVYRWLESTAELVRSLDSNHLITAGWLSDSLDTEPYVDFLSFHHWTSADALASQARNLHDFSDKPILLEEFGYSTYHLSPEQQSQLIKEVILAAESEQLAGWLVWAAFDFPLDATCIPPACPSADNAEHHFGLWQSDYTPKPAVEILERLITRP